MVPPSRFATAWMGVVTSGVCSTSPVHDEAGEAESGTESVGGVEAAIRREWSHAPFAAALFVMSIVIQHKC